MKQAIWISYDLGIKGDYPELYRWLDTHKAKECGNSFAYITYQYNTDISKELKADLIKNIAFNPGDRIYALVLEKHEGKDQYYSMPFLNN